MIEYIYLAWNHTIVEIQIKEHNCTGLFTTDHKSHTSNNSYHPDAFRLQAA